MLYIVGALLTSPRRAFAEVARAGGVRRALALLALFAAASALSTATSLRWVLEPVPKAFAGPAFLLAAFAAAAASVPAAAAAWAASSLTAYGVCRALGGRGGVVGTMVAYAYSSVAAAAYVAAALAASVAGVLGAACGAFLAAGAAAALAAALYLQVRGLQAVHGLGVGRAVAAALLAFAAVSVLAFLAAAVAAPMLLGGGGGGGFE